MKGWSFCRSLEAMRDDSFILFLSHGVSCLRLRALSCGFSKRKLPVCGMLHNFKLIELKSNKSSLIEMPC
tara:strand:- start:286 stop:495 length:210 start_codon:yes stop_codon:yes gene_type:complete